MGTREQALLDHVRDALERELRPVVDELFEEVVRGLVRERLNGHGAAKAAPGVPDPTREPEPEGAPAANAAPPPEPELEPQTMKLCRTCRQEKPVFGRDRGTCKECRRADERERAARKRENGTVPEVTAEDPPVSQPA